MRIELGSYYRFLIMLLAFPSVVCFSQNRTQSEFDPSSKPKVQMSSAVLKISYLSYVEITEILKEKVDKEYENGYFQKLENYDVRIYEEPKLFRVMFLPKPKVGEGPWLGGGIVLIYNKKTFKLEDTIMTK